MTPQIVAATAGRVLRQLRGDHRTVALLLVLPGALIALTHQMIDSRPVFDRLALSLLGIFPFTTMFLITSVAMLRGSTTRSTSTPSPTPRSRARSRTSSAATQVPPSRCPVPRRRRSSRGSPRSCPSGSPSSTRAVSHSSPG
jgi:hypothetical protein